MFSKRSILLVEDDVNFGKVLAAYLEAVNYNVVWVQNGQEAWGKYTSNYYDLVISDIMMPVEDGFSLAKKIKTKNPQQAFVFLTAKTLKEDVLQGFELGADDYINKPFDAEILLRKIAALLNRASIFNTNQSNKTYTIGNASFDTNSRTLFLTEKKIVLSPKEAAILTLLCSNINQFVARKVLLNSIWGNDNYFNGRSMDVYITKLRKLISSIPSCEIETLHGTGYKLIG